LLETSKHGLYSIGSIIIGRVTIETISVNPILIELIALRVIESSKRRLHTRVEGLRVATGSRPVERCALRGA
jgi:hypothetical protein